MKKFLLSTILLAGCVNANQIGPGLFSITSQGPDPMTGAYAKAAEVCPSGFDLVDGERGESPLGQSKQIVVRCK